MSRRLTMAATVALAAAVAVAFSDSSIVVLALPELLTHRFDWRAIFFVQAPVAGLGLAAVFHRRITDLPRARVDRPRLLTADSGLLFLFGSIVGALFLSVLLVVTVWQFSPIEGALV